MDITHITSLLGGIALFLYGMSIMGAGLEKLAGGKMHVSISRHGNHTTRLYGRKGVDPHRMADCVRLLPVYNSSISCARYQCTRSASFPTHIACEMVAV